MRCACACACVWFVLYNTVKIRVTVDDRQWLIITSTTGTTTYSHLRIDDISHSTKCRCWSSNPRPSGRGLICRGLSIDVVNAKMRVTVLNRRDVSVTPFFLAAIKYFIGGGITDSACCYLVQGWILVLICFHAEDTPTALSLSLSLPFSVTRIHTHRHEDRSVM